MSDDQLQLNYPEYGTVASLLGLVPVVAAAGPATEVVAERVPSLPVGVLFAMALWGLLAVVLYVEYRKQDAANPHSFDDRGPQARFLREGTPGAGRLLLALTGLIGGGFLAVMIWPLFIDGVARVARALVALPAVPGGTFWGELLEIAFFGVVYAGFAHGADRVLIGLLRMALYRNATMRGRP